MTDLEAAFVSSKREELVTRYASIKL